MKDKTFNKPIVRSLIRPDVRMDILHALASMHVYLVPDSLLVGLFYLFISCSCLLGESNSVSTTRHYNYDYQMQSPPRPGSGGEARLC